MLLNFPMFLNFPTRLAFLLLLPMLLASLSAAATSSRTRSQSNKQALGSLTVSGEAYVNGAAAPSESTIFVGDTLRTGADGTATFTLSGKGSFKVAPQSEIVFSGESQYVAVLEGGTVILNSFPGATDVTLRIGNYIAGPVVQAEESSAKIERHSDASVVVTCLSGSVGLIPLEGTTGQVIQADQTVAISSGGEIGQPQAVAKSEPATPASQAPQHTAAQKSNKGWIILGVVGAGAAIGAAAAAAGGGGKGGEPVSPSSP
jgi:ferric-dicitrate binding protein FerR (iron transport regulator)